MSEILIFSQNRENYTIGSYHQDLIDAFKKKFKVHIYGPGYKYYNKEDNFKDVIDKLHINLNNLEFIVCSTSWDNENILEGDPHPKLDFNKISNIPKIYFFNKEYKKFATKVEYCKKNNFDIICTVNLNYEKWKSKYNINFVYLPFGINLENFKFLNIEKKYDLSFTGSLHETFTNQRLNFKKEIFLPHLLNLKSNHGLHSIFRKNFLKKKYQKFKIFWAEWGAKNFIGRSLLPTGLKYSKLMNSSNFFFNTLSAANIINTRFYEIMASGSVVLCPENINYGNFLENEKNCVMIKNDCSDLYEKLTYYKENSKKLESIINYSLILSKEFSYEKRIDDLCLKIRKL